MFWHLTHSYTFWRILSGKPDLVSLGNFHSTSFLKMVFSLVHISFYYQTTGCCVCVFFSKPRDKIISKTTLLDLIISLKKRGTILKLGFHPGSSSFNSIFFLVQLVQFFISNHFYILSSAYSGNKFNQLVKERDGG